MVRHIKYSYQVAALTFWLLVVGALFTLIDEKQVAGLFAGLGFIFLPGAFFVGECKSTSSPIVHRISLLCFLLFSALPIFFLRVLNWGTPFAELTLFGMSGPELHRQSNILYVIMLLTAAYAWWKCKQASNANI